MSSVRSNDVNVSTITEFNIQIVPRRFRMILHVVGNRCAIYGQTNFVTRVIENAASLEVQSDMHGFPVLAGPLSPLFSSG